MAIIPFSRLHRLEQFCCAPNIFLTDNQDYDGALTKADAVEVAQCMEDKVRKDAGLSASQAVVQDAGSSARNTIGKWEK